MSEKKKRPLTVYLDEDLFRALAFLSEKEGYPSILDYVVKLIKERVEGAEKGGLEDSVKARVARIVQDELNKQLQVIESLRRQVAELYERVDYLTSVVEEIKSRAAEVSEQRRERRKTGIERLREEKVVFESGLPKKLNRDAFFNYLRREGAVVIETSKERIAVDPDFWEDFKTKLFEKAATSDEDELRKALGDKGFMLFTKLRDDNQVIYDPVTKKWKNLVNVTG
ncbi:CopG family transcriptional regulator [Thermogladius sp. KZ2Tp1]|uniref:CopG family transcriptional regulator n=1 Tax=Thermogladius sp. KZ2Tp1 TaxID=3136289 RepID=UPI003DAA49AD